MIIGYKGTSLILHKGNCNSQWRQLPLWHLVIAFVPLKSSGKTVKFPHSGALYQVEKGLGALAFKKKEASHQAWKILGL